MVTSLGWIQTSFDFSNLDKDSSDFPPPKFPNSQKQKSEVL